MKKYQIEVHTKTLGICHVEVEIENTTTYLNNAHYEGITFPIGEAFIHIPYANVNHMLFREMPEGGALPQ
jgi:hypothetical protein